jgi:hypothetical protein
MMSRISRRRIPGGVLGVRLLWHRRPPWLLPGLLLPGLLLGLLLVLEDPCRRCAFVFKFVKIHRYGVKPHLVESIYYFWYRVRRDSPIPFVSFYLI